MTRMVAVGSIICEMDGTAIDLFNQAIAERDAATARAQAAEADTAECRRERAAYSDKVAAALGALENECERLRELNTDRDKDLRHEYSRANTAEAECERLRAQVATLTTCDCGRPLSPGQCGICDNDD